MRPLLSVAGSHVSIFLNLNVSGTNRDIVLKQRYDRFLSVGDTPMPLLKVLINLRISINF